MWHKDQIERLSGDIMQKLRQMYVADETDKRKAIEVILRDAVADAAALDLPDFIPHKMRSELKQLMIQDLIKG